MASSAPSETGPTDFAIRAGTPADDAACGRIISAATLAAPTAARLPHARALFADASPLEPEGYQRLVAERDRVLGFADYDPARAHLRYLFVAPEAQGRGIGGALLARVRESLGARPLTLSCFAVNDRALAWYLRRGFTITGGGFKALAGHPVVEIQLALAPAR